jgi:hypothetical protein
MPIPQPKFSTLPRDVNDIAAKGRPEIGPVRIVSPFFLRHTQVIPPTPGSRNEPRPQVGATARPQERVSNFVRGGVSQAASGS